MEGHPDNIAAAVHGGMVVAAITSQQAAKASEPVEVLVARVDVSPKLDFIVVIPETPLPTEKARAALPAEYSRADVVANLQRTALLTACFFSGRRLSPELFRDRLHQPYRSPLVPGIAQALEFRHPGLVGIFLSGAGSAVMAIAEHSSARIGEALVAEFGRQGVVAQDGAVEGRQSRDAGNHGRAGALARPGGSDSNTSRVTARGIESVDVDLTEQVFELRAQVSFGVAILHNHGCVKREAPFAATPV